jgi:hypothetical protein
MSLPHLENSDLQEGFLSKTHSIITGNNVLDATASNLDFFLKIYVCSTQPNSPIWSKQSISQHETPMLQELSHSKTTSILTGKQCANATGSKANGFLSRDTCVSSPQLNRHVCHKESLSPL